MIFQSSMKKLLRSLVLMMLVFSCSQPTQTEKDLRATINKEVSLEIFDLVRRENYNCITIEPKEKFRFVRYLSPASLYGNISSLAFYESMNSDVPLSGVVIGTEDLQGADSGCAKARAFDYNALTYFDAPIADYAWLGLDLGEDRYIEKIRFLARTDYNIIVPGNVYELFYWNNKWISLGRQSAESHTLVFDQVPSNALYYLKNHSEGKEERIFTYDDKEQIW